jgi:hypothetical protein
MLIKRTSPSLPKLTKIDAYTANDRFVIVSGTQLVLSILKTVRKIKWNEAIHRIHYQVMKCYTKLLPIFCLSLRNREQLSYQYLNKLFISG